MLEINSIFLSKDENIFAYAAKRMLKTMHCLVQPYITMYENHGIPVFCFTVPESGDRKFLRMVFGDKYGIRQNDSIDMMKRKLELDRIVSLQYTSTDPYELSNIPLKPFQNTIVRGQAMIIADDLNIRSNLEFFTLTIGIYQPEFISKERNDGSYN